RCGRSPGAVAVEDINGDGLQDLAVAVSGSVAILLNDGVWSGPGGAPGGGSGDGTLAAALTAGPGPALGTRPPPPALPPRPAPDRRCPPCSAAPSLRSSRSVIWPRLMCPCDCRAGPRRLVSVRLRQTC